MINIITWISNRKQPKNTEAYLRESQWAMDKDTEAYLRGFQWAMGEIFIARNSVQHVSDIIGYQDDAFDKGAIYALRVIQEGMKPESVRTIQGKLGCDICKGYIRKGGNSESNLDTEVCPRCFP